MNPDALFAASRYVARPVAEVAAALLAMADRAWTMTVPAGRFALTRRRAGSEARCPGERHVCVDGVLLPATDPTGVDVEVAMRPCGDRATELLLRPRWSKAQPCAPELLDAVLLLASLSMDSLAADLAAELSTAPRRRPRPSPATALVAG